MVLKSNRPKEQTDAQWMKSTRKKLKDPDDMLKNYGRHRFDLIAQFELTLSRTVSADHYHSSAKGCTKRSVVRY